MINDNTHHRQHFTTILYFGNAGPEGALFEGDQLVSLLKSVASSKGHRGAADGSDGNTIRDGVQADTNASNNTVRGCSSKLEAYQPYYQNEFLNQKWQGQSINLPSALPATELGLVDLPIQITLTLMLKNAPTIEDSAEDVALSKVAWQVLSIDNLSAGLVFNCPVY